MDATGLIRIVRAAVEHKKMAAKLFDAYRSFYRQPSDLPLAEKFVFDRLRKQDSFFMLALKADNTPVGFAQLYPSFTSVGAASILVLNDLFVVSEFRNQGIGRKLLEAAKQLAEQQGVAKIVLETGKDNVGAQRLYDSLGYVKAHHDFETYSLKIEPRIEVDASPHDFKRDNRKLVVITGVTSGLGAAMVKEFDRMGWMIAGCGRSVSEITKLQRSFSNSHYFNVVDVSDPMAVEGWAKRLNELCGVPDLVINNASIINHPATAWEIPEKEFSDVMRINVGSVVNVTRSFIPFMLPRATGVFVNISSGWGRAGDKSVSAYCASKFAVEGYSQSLALELPKGMAVVTLDPKDGIATPMLSVCSSPEYVATAPTADAWARVAVPFIAAIDSSKNGQSLTCPSVSTPESMMLNESAEKKKGAEDARCLSRLGLWKKPALVVSAAVAAASVLVYNGMM